MQTTARFLTEDEAVAVGNTSGAQKSGTENEPGGGTVNTGSQRWPGGVKGGPTSEVPNGST